MVRSLRIFILSFLFFTFLGSCIYAESFRVHNTIIIDMSENSAKAGINDCLYILLPEDKTYLNAIELEIKIPKLFTEWPYSIMYYIYNNISPQPQEAIIDYRGEKIHSNIVPSRLTWVLQIPVKKGIKIKETPYTAVVPVAPNTENGGVFFRFQLAMKGVPQEFDTSYFSITAKPIFAEVGTLALSYTTPDGSKVQPHTIFIDGKEVAEEESGIVLSTGIHSVSVVSDYYRNEVRTVTIEQAKLTNLDITLRDITPEIRISAPENAVIYLDDVLLTKWDNALQVQEGDHVFKFIIGDYEIIKTVKAENGRSYTVTLGIDASITEDSVN